MSKEESLDVEQHQQVTNKSIAEEVRTRPPEVRLGQLQTMFATAHRDRQPDPDREAAAAEVRELWRLLKERFHASI
jgi:hypothetical protein